MSPDRRRSARRQRGGSLTERPRPRRPTRIVYVVCEGEVTEYEYFTMVNNDFGDRDFRLDFPSRRERRRGLKPREVVERAIHAAAEEQADVVWALFDRDQHVGISAAFQDVRDRPTIRIGFSNPSFDLWLLLHFQPYTPRTHGSSREVHAKLRSCRGFDGFGGSDKHITDERAGVLAGRLPTAVRHARQQVDDCPTKGCSAAAGHQPACDPLDRDPSTDVYLLIESLGIG